MDKVNIVQLAVDYNKGAVEKYSKDEAKEVIRGALVAANGGNTTLTLKSFRDNPGLYQIIEEIIARTVPQGLSQNDFFNNFCEVKNMAEGDVPQFTIKSNSYLLLADISRGNQAIRRQRIGEAQSITLVPTPKAIKLYDELTRVLSGRVDINDLVNAVTQATEQTRLNEIYLAWSGVINDAFGKDRYIPVAGVYDEEVLFNLIDDVSIANNGAKCTLLTTMKGARKLTTGIMGNSAKEDYYKNGYILNWNGTPVQIIPQHYEYGNISQTIFPDGKIYVIPVGMDRPIKQVIGGNDYLSVKDGTDNADLTPEVTFITSTATAVVTGDKYGIYDIT